MAGTTAHYGAQTKARKAALDILFMAEQRDASISETFAEQRSLRGGIVRELTTQIVLGVAENQHDIDARIDLLTKEGEVIDATSGISWNSTAIPVGVTYWASLVETAMPSRAA